MESNRLSARLPLLPTEMKQLILRFCTPATLAVASRVSAAFLVLSAPLLYADIELVGLDKVEQLFCHRERPSVRL